jgi:hypothetical protein
MKQDTPEEEVLGKLKFLIACGNDAQAIRFLEEYAEFQKERMYSGEEVLSILNKMFEWYIDDTPYHFNLTMLKNKFEQFKKK